LIGNLHDEKAVEAIYWERKAGGNSSRYFSFAELLGSRVFERTIPDHLAVDSEGNYYTPAQTTSDPNIVPTGPPSSPDSDRIFDDHPPTAIKNP
jgi:hypothetical protein